MWSSAKLGLVMSELARLIQQLTTVYDEMGEKTYDRALHRARHAVAVVVLDEAEKMATFSNGKRAINHHRT